MCFGFPGSVTMTSLLRANDFAGLLSSFET